MENLLVSFESSKDLVLEAILCQYQTDVIVLANKHLVFVLVQFGSIDPELRSTY